MSSRPLRQWHSRGRDSGTAPSTHGRCLRGQRLVSATLEKACQGRDYYSGFLVSQHSDGQLCVDRDELLARSGAKCKVQGYREMMLVED